MAMKDIYTPFHMRQALDELQLVPPGANALYAGYARALVHSQLAIADAIERQTKLMTYQHDEHKEEKALKLSEGDT